MGINEEIKRKEKELEDLNQKKEAAEAKKQQAQQDLDEANNELGQKSSGGLLG